MTPEATPTRVVLIGLADIHGHGSNLARLAGPLRSAHRVLLLGDVTNFGIYDDMERIFQAVAQHNPHVLGVPGNCDYPEAGRCLDDHQANLDGRSVCLHGLYLVGVGRSLPCPGRTPNETDERWLAARLAEAASAVPPEAPLVLVSHEPPWQTRTDLAFTRRHVGSHSVRRFIEERQPLVALVGHIHEARGVDAIGRTRIVNPGPWRSGGYAWVELTQADDQWTVATCEVRSA